MIYDPREEAYLTTDIKKYIDDKSVVFYLFL